MYKYSPNEKGKVYGPSGKDIMAPIEYTLMVYILNGKSMLPWKIVFRSGNYHGKR